jgi:hypothetical protein
MVVTEGKRSGEKRSLFFNGQFQSSKMKKCYRSDSHYWTVHLKVVNMVNFMVSVFFITLKMGKGFEWWSSLENRLAIAQKYNPPISLLGIPKRSEYKVKT